MFSGKTDAQGRHARVLEIAGLQQRLFDRQRGEEFRVFVRQPIVITAGSFVAILGPSGCGKTTLLTVLGLLRAPSHPERLERFSIWTPGPNGPIEQDLKAAWKRRSQRQIEHLRRRHLGFALQSGELLSSLTVRENIAAPLRLNGMRRAACRQRVAELLAAFGLADPPPAELHAGRSKPDRSPVQGRIALSRINKLSGGEYQRVALARAIAHRPALVFVDEPTAALNRELARGALEQLGRLQRGGQFAGATVMITHDEGLAEEFADTIIRMAPLKDRPAGEVVEIVHKQAPSRADRVDGHGELCEQI